MADVRVSLDGTDVTGVSIRGSWTPRLNRPAQSTITIPMDAAIGDVGSMMLIELDTGGGFNPVFHGFVLVTETDTDKDQGTTQYNAQDPMELWQWRPVRADDGDFTKPVGSGETNGNDLIATYLTGPLIMEAVLKNTEGDSTAQGNGSLTPPGQAEGPTFLDFGNFISGGPELTGAPVDWPMTIADFCSLLMSTGQLDLVITPTDPGGGIMGTIDGYNGNYGTDLSGSISFQYGMGARNVQALRWNRDMTSVVNKYWLFGGPRIKSAADPAGDQHWCFNVTGDDCDLCGNSGTPTCIDSDGNVTHGVGGALPTSIAALCPGGTAYDGGILGDRRADSQNTAGPNGTGYGVRMKVDVFDAYDDDCIPGFGTVGRELYRRQWQEFSWIAAMPRELIHVTPNPDAEIGTFGIGDLVTVEATPAVRGGFSGVQRIYSYTVGWEGPESVLSLGELQTSSDAEF